jgi:hypothetical protein
MERLAKRQTPSLQREWTRVRLLAREKHWIRCVLGQVESTRRVCARVSIHCVAVWVPVTPSFSET